jgi:hypothetical protein
MAAVAHSPYVMVRARNDMIEAGMFLVANCCSAHAKAELVQRLTKTSFRKQAARVLHECRKVFWK